MRAGLGRLALERGEWAGMPMPVEGTRMVIHPSYPFAEKLGQTYQPRPELRVCSDRAIDETVSHRNSWRSYRDGKELTIWRDSKGFYYTHGLRQNAGRLLIDTVGAARAWDVEAEVRAMETLRRHVTEWAWNCYLMTGSFLESSPRSRVSYMFRRLRPTIALTANPDYKRGKGDVGMRILCALCMHPVGFYNGSWAGALVPTDDVIAHLLLMRADEHEYWKQANQHPAWAPEAGL